MAGSKTSHTPVMAGNLARSAASASLASGPTEAAKLYPEPGKSGSWTVVGVVDADAAPRVTRSATARAGLPAARPLRSPVVLRTPATPGVPSKVLVLALPTIGREPSVIVDVP